MSKYKNGYQNLTLLDRIDRAMLSRRFEIAMLFVCFVLAPAYILFHIVSFIVRSI